MKQKNLQVDEITNELASASHFFNPLPDPMKAISPPSGAPTIHNQPAPLKTPQRGDRLQKPTSMHARKHESMHESTHESKSASMHVDKQESKQAYKQANIKENQGGEQREGNMHEPMHARKQNDYIDAIRKSVKKVGREELYVRLTPEEKSELRSAVFQINELYRGKGGKTSENEISRIALKFLLEDYKANRENSILLLTEEALNA